MRRISARKARDIMKCNDGVLTTASVSI